MDEVNLYEYWLVIKKRKRLIFGCTFIAAVFAVIFMFFAPRYYQGSASVIFPEQKQNVSMLSQLGGLPVLNSMGIGSKNTQGQYVEIGKSRRVTEKVIKKLALDKLDVEYSDLQDCMQIKLTDNGGLSIVSLVPTSWLKSGSLEWLDQKMPGASVKRKTAQLAADVANAYVDELAAFQEKYSVSSAHKDRIFVESELEKTKDNLSKAEDKLRDFKRANPAVILPTDESANYEQLALLRSEWRKTKTALSESERKLEASKSELTGQPETVIASEVVSDNPVVTDLKRDLAKLEVKRASLLQDRTEAHPDVVDTEEQIAATTGKIKDEITKITSSEVHELNPVRQKLLEGLVLQVVETDGLQAREKAMAQVLAESEQEISRTVTPQLKLVRLARETKALETQYTTLLAERAKAQIDEAKDPETFLILDRAEAEKHHVKPRGKFVLLGALFFGFCGGCAWAFAIEGSVRARKRMN